MHVLAVMKNDLVVRANALFHSFKTTFPVAVSYKRELPFFVVFSCFFQSTIFFDGKSTL